jgi:hypothetical protein
MSEMAAFLRMQGKLPLCVIQYPTKRWGFVGTVPACLAYTNTPEEIRKYHGMGITGKLKTRVWNTKEEALEACKEAGYTAQE